MAQTPVAINHRQCGSQLPIQIQTHSGLKFYFPKF